METIVGHSNLIPIDNHVSQQEAKPIKGFNFNTDVQRFEQILYYGQNFMQKGGVNIDPVNQPNAISRLGKNLFEKLGKYKKSSDLKMKKVNESLSNKNNLDDADLLRVHWEIAQWEVENRLISTCGNKVSEGIQTLFRNQ